MLSERLYVTEDKKREKEGIPPLQGMCSFQGLDIMVENQKGTDRQWGKKPDQKSHMYYDYGYVVGTKGWDGDEVDVYVGKNFKSNTVFVVTQMKSPDFKEVDEQKIFLGFDTIEQVREAYLNQYSDPRFMGAVEVITVDMLKLRLALTGSARKALNTLTKAAKIEEDKSVDKDKKMNKAKAESIEILKNVGCAVAGEKLKKQDMLESKTDKAISPTDIVSPTDAMGKALRSSAIVGIARRARMDEYSAGVAREQPVVGTNRERGEFEPPVVPVRVVETPQPTYATPESLTDCNQCGYVYKSLEKCPRCTRIASLGGEALPLHFRGR